MFVVNAQQEGGRFNSQPPEGGWVLKIRKELRDGWFQLTAARRRLAKRRGAINPTGRFNSQPPEGGWIIYNKHYILIHRFQLTAARRRLAMPPLRGMGLIRVSTHSRPKAAGLVFIDWFGFRICFNSQPPEGGWQHFGRGYYSAAVSTHSRPKAAGGGRF